MKRLQQLLGFVPLQHKPAMTQLHPKQSFIGTIVCLPTAGCGGLQQAEVSGEVSYDGKPIESRFMRFFPIRETPGDGPSVDVMDGKYSLAADAGLATGTYHVSIMATRETGRQVVVAEPMPGDPPFVMETIQYLPDRFNLRTGLEVTLKPGANQEDFVPTSN